MYVGQSLPRIRLLTAGFADVARGSGDGDDMDEDKEFDEVSTRS